MTPSSFSDQPDRADPLQVVGDAALDTIRMGLAAHGIESEAYSVVITLEYGDRLATVLHLPDDPPEEHHQALAFQTQLVHLGATAKALGVSIRIIPLPEGGTG